MMFLRQNTAVDVAIGPFVSDANGFTAMTALTLAQADIRLKKNNGAWAQKNDATSATHEENGNYEIELDATDTDTLGILRIHVNEAGALPVWEIFTILPAVVYDALILATDNLEVNTVQIEGSDASDVINAQADQALVDYDAATAADLTAAIAGLNNISAADVTNAVFAALIEGSLTFAQVQRIVLAAVAGKSNSPAAGQRAYRDQADTKDRILATVSGGDRSSVTVDGA